MHQLVASTDPVLREIADDVTEFDNDLAGLIAEMYLILDYMDGAVALAAPQIGVSTRVVVYDLRDGTRGALVNPEIVSHSTRARMVTEGCLSFPGQFWRVRRALSVETKARDRMGSVHFKRWHGMGAQMVQHEVDHLDGILLPDKALLRVR